MASALASRQEIPEYTVKSVSVTTGSVKTSMAKSVGAMGSVPAVDVFAKMAGLGSCANIHGSAT